MVPKEWLEVISGALVFGSSIPYLTRIYQGKISPSTTSFALWTLIGFTLLLTYKSSGAEGNVLPVVFGFVNQCTITAMSIWRKGSIDKLTRIDWVCVLLCLVSLASWWQLRLDREMVQLALYLALAADVFAGLPAVRQCWNYPKIDRPGAWMIFTLGYFVSLFTISDMTVANISVPLWMIAIGLAITIPLAAYRVRQGVPLREWI